MHERLEEIASSTTALIISALCLVASFLIKPHGLLDPAWITVIINGIPLVLEALERLIERQGVSRISSSLLITLAMIATIAIGDLFAAGEIAFIMSIGELLEEKTIARAQKGLHSLLQLSPTQGRKLVEGHEETIAVETIQPGDILRILPGETIPADGSIVSGSTSINQAALTGESLPVDKGVGDDVFSGSINCFGAIDIKATKAGADSSVQKLVRLVQEAEEKQAPTARLADKAASWLVPLALLIALATWMITGDTVRAVTVLVVFCPCALVLATPTAIMAAIGQASKNGVIIKSGEALERMGKVNTLAFDKTGTLTQGSLQVSDIIPCTPDYSPEQLLKLTAAAETKSEHPLGQAIVSSARKRQLEVQETTSFQMTAGQGIRAIVAGREVLCGNERLLSEAGISIPQNVANKLAELRQQGKASVLVAGDGRCLGLIALSDTLRPQAKGIVQSLRDLKADIALLSGDHLHTASYFATEMNITRVHSQLLPQQKMELIDSWQSAGERVCMIGDGINDAPALKAAHVGIAMGSMGSDIAIEAADIALMGDDLSRLPYLKRLSEATRKTITLSIWLSVLINLAAIVLSVKGWLNPTWGALVHNAGSCFVILLATLLYDRKFTEN